MVTTTSVLKLEERYLIQLVRVLKDFNVFSIKYQSLLKNTQIPLKDRFYLAYSHMSHTLLGRYIDWYWNSVILKHSPYYDNGLAYCLMSYMREILTRRKIVLPKPIHLLSLQEVSLIFKEDKK